MIKKLLIGFFLLLVTGCTVFFIVLPPLVDQSKNTVTGAGLLPIENETRTLHENLVIADLHADSLLWGRDLTKKSDRGMTDFPRMQQGNLALQVFSVVTKTPRGLNISRNKDDTDNITLLAIAQRWPWKTYTSLSQRAFYLSERLHDMSARSNGRFEIIKNRNQLDGFLQRRSKQPELIAGLLALEGAQSLEGNIENLQKFSAAGYRMVSPAHFFDTEVGGSAHGWNKSGLTGLGKEWVKKMDESCLIIDLSHASSKVFTEVLELTTRPVVVSHTGVKGSCNNNRNLSDAQLKALARNGGLIGIGFWPVATCGNKVIDIAKAIRHAVDVAGVQHIALGSDFDGSVTVPFDASGMIQITQALRNEGFSDLQIEAIMGGNVIRFLRQTLGDNSCYRYSG